MSSLRIKLKMTSIVVLVTMALPVFSQVLDEPATIFIDDQVKFKDILSIGTTNLKITRWHTRTPVADSAMNKVLVFTRARVGNIRKCKVTIVMNANAVMEMAIETRHFRDGARLLSSACEAYGNARIVERPIRAYLWRFFNGNGYVNANLSLIHGGRKTILTSWIVKRAGEPAGKNKVKMF